MVDLTHDHASTSLLEFRDGQSVCQMRVIEENHVRGWTTEIEMDIRIPSFFVKD